MPLASFKSRMKSYLFIEYRSLSATNVVLVVVIRFSKFPKTLLIRNRPQFRLLTYICDHFIKLPLRIVKLIRNLKINTLLAVVAQSSDHK